MATRSTKTEFGDFQTPLPLARAVCALIASSGEKPATVVEPTCGAGAFLVAADRAFPQAVLYGCDSNPAHVETARRRLRERRRLHFDVASFFNQDWRTRLADFPQPLLVLGNPPWVTNSNVGAIGGGNLPPKSNADGLRGIQAITGSANFDISEWMIRQNFRWLDGRAGTVAVLCKTSVARKVLLHAWSSGARIGHAAIHRFDAAKAFGVAVDACMLHVRFAPAGKSNRCEVYETLEASTPSASLAYRDGVLLADAALYESVSDLRTTRAGSWRSGLKHDCSRVFELRCANGRFVNGLREEVSVESTVVFPLLKSSDVAQRRPPRRRVLVPQRSMAESPLDLERRAPKAWRYLLAHQDAIGERASSVYRKRPPFSIFGIGPYSFSPWKVAVAGLHKALRFVKVGPVDGRPVLLDDTCYFLPCETQRECDAIMELVTSPVATQFYSSLAFWDAKRPITAKLLNQLDLTALAKRLGKWNVELARALNTVQWNSDMDRSKQTRLI